MSLVDKVNRYYKARLSEDDLILADEFIRYACENPMPGNQVFIRGFGYGLGIL